MQALETEGNETAKEEIKKVQYEQHINKYWGHTLFDTKKKDSVWHIEHKLCHSML